MYSLKCEYYNKFFDTIEELIEDVISSGMDPNYEFTFNNESIKESAIDHIQF